MRFTTTYILKNKKKDNLQIDLDLKDLKRPFIKLIANPKKAKNKDMHSENQGLNL